jgi:hypothetical protein
MAPGGKAFIIFNFPPGVSFFAICRAQGERALCGVVIMPVTH